MSTRLTDRQCQILEILADAGDEGTCLSRDEARVAWRLWRLSPRLAQWQRRTEEHDGKQHMIWHLTPAGWDAWNRERKEQA